MVKKVKSLLWKDRVDKKQSMGTSSQALKQSGSVILRLAGHFYREKSSPANMTDLWQHKHGTVARGRSGTNLVNTLLKNTEQKTITDLHSLSHRDVWKSVIGLRGENLDRK